MKVINAVAQSITTTSFTPELFVLLCLYVAGEFLMLFIDFYNISKILISTI
jgi:hypothetical protein